MGFAADIQGGSFPSVKPLWTCPELLCLIGDSKSSEGNDEDQSPQVHSLST